MEGYVCADCMGCLPRPGNRNDPRLIDKPTLEDSEMGNEIGCAKIATPRAESKWDKLVDQATEVMGLAGSVMNQAGELQQRMTGDRTDTPPNGDQCGINCAFNNLSSMLTEINSHLQETRNSLNAIGG